MGQLTRDQIVSEGQLLAGRDDNATASAAWLQRWLDSVAASWPWPVLQSEATAIAVTSGVASVTLGNGSGGITPKMLKVLDNIWLYDSTRTFRRRIRIRHQLSSPGDRVGPTDNTGTPSNVRLFNSSFGVWVLYFDAIPDRAYLLTIPYLVLPAALTTGSEVPWYPNDETMVQWVAFKNREFYEGIESPACQAAQQNLSQMLANDRMRHGQVTGVNDSMILDATTFPKSRR